MKKQASRTYLTGKFIPQILTLSTPVATALIRNRVRALEKFFRESGFKRAVIGLSGGIDSAVACALTCRAIGSKNVFVVRLPCGTGTNSESVHIADEIVAAQKIPRSNVYTVNITATVEASWGSVWPFPDNPETKNLRYGNMAARERMKVLMDLATTLNALVVGTENKTEHYLAYYTIGGDNVSNVEPIYHLYKTQVYQIAAYLDLPESVLMRAPTAELWADQTDEGELGVDYITADYAIYCLLAVGAKAAVAMAEPLGFDPAKVQKVIDRVKRIEGKRNAPHII